MKAKTLADLLTPFRYVCDPDSIVPAYRNVSADEMTLACHTAWAKLEAFADLGLTTNLLLPGRALFAVASSLPESEQEVLFAAENGTLKWKAGTARGQFATLPGEPLAGLPRPGKVICSLDSERVKSAFELGALSCGNPALASLGMNGMQIHLRDKGWFLSCDNATISSYQVEIGSPVSVLCTLSPKAAELIHVLCTKHPGQVKFLEDQVIYTGEYIKAVLAQIPPLKTDLLELALAYQAKKLIVPLPRDNVAAFVKRAQNLAEVKQKCIVQIVLSEGHITLSFAEETSETEEYYLVEGLPSTLACSINVDAARLARALVWCTHVCLDFAPQDILIFVGGAYSYIVSGKQKDSAQESA